MFTLLARWPWGSPRTSAGLPVTGGDDLSPLRAVRSLTNGSPGCRGALRLGPAGWGPEPRWLAGWHQADPFTFQGSVVSSLKQEDWGLDPFSFKPFGEYVLRPLHVSGTGLVLRSQGTNSYISPLQELPFQWVKPTAANYIGITPKLEHTKNWAPKNWCFWAVVLEKTLESPLNCKEIQPVHPKGDQSWVFIGRTDAEADAPKLWPPDAKSWLIGEDPDAGKDGRQEEKGMTEDEMVVSHHQLNGHEFEQTPEGSEGQGSLACCGPWGRKELDTTEWLNNNDNT